MNAYYNDKSASVRKSGVNGIGMDDYTCFIGFQGFTGFGIKPVKTRLPFSVDASHGEIS